MIRARLALYGQIAAQIWCYIGLHKYLETGSHPIGRSEEIYRLLPGISLACFVWLTCEIAVKLMKLWLKDGAVPVNTLLVYVVIVALSLGMISLTEETKDLLLIRY